MDSQVSLALTKFEKQMSLVVASRGPVFFYCEFTSYDYEARFPIRKKRNPDSHLR